MAENNEPQTEDTEVEETEVEAHAMSILPLQGLGKPEDGIAESDGKSTFSIGC